MLDLSALFAIPAILLCALLFLRRGDQNAALNHWAASLVALFFWGMLSTEDAPMSALALGAMAHGLWIAMLIGGTAAFTGHGNGRGPVMMILAWGALYAGASLIGLDQPASLVTAGVDLPFFVLASYWAFQSARKTGASQPEWALGPVFLLIGVVNAWDLVSRGLAMDRSMALPVWSTTAAGLGMLQVLAVYERVRLSDAKHAEALEDERRKLRAVLETAPLDIFLFDDEGRLAMMNQSAARRVGMADVSPEGLERAQHRLTRARQAAGPERALQRVHRLVAEDPMCVLEDFELTIPGHEEQTHQLFSSPVSSETGEWLGRVWITRDVTSERDLQSQLRQAQKMETLGTLAGGVAHDFNNQLTTILGNTELALDDCPETESDLRESLEDIARSAQHCAELTTGLLAFARRAPLETRVVEVAPLLGEVESLLRAALPISVTLDVQVESPIAKIEADPTLVQQVLLNLAINARDAVGGKGRIEIVAHGVDTPHAAKEANEGFDRSCICIEVRDDGIGMDRTTRERIFEPFFTTKPVGEGTGLGLAIVYGAVTAHHGWIEVDSQPGSGTTVRVFLPIAERTDVPSTTRRQPAQGHGEVILLVDDEDGVRRVAKQMLERAGYKVLEAASGERAIEIFDGGGTVIHGVVLDLAMPGMDGLETLEELRKRAPTLPVVIASGYVDRPERFTTSAGVRLLAKPYQSESLSGALRQVLDEFAEGGEQA